MGEKEGMEGRMPPLDKANSAVVISGGNLEANAEGLVESGDCFGDEDRSTISTESSRSAIDAHHARDEEVSNQLRVRMTLGSSGGDVARELAGEGDDVGVFVNFTTNRVDVR